MGWPDTPIGEYQTKLWLDQKPPAGLKWLQVEMAQSKSKVVCVAVFLFPVWLEDHTQVSVT
jgi:hypothetical protein